MARLDRSFDGVRFDHAGISGSYLATVCRLHGHNRACLQIHGRLLDGEVATDTRRTSEVFSCGPLDPFSFWQPHLFCRQAACLVAGCHNGRGQHLVAEQVLIFAGIGFVGFGPVVIERPQKCYACVIRAPCFRVKVGLQRVAKLNRRAKNRRVRLGAGGRSDRPGS